VLSLAARRRRKEEEERQVAEVRAQAEAKTEALRRQKEQQRLLERIQNYFLSQQMKKSAGSRGTSSPTPRPGRQNRTHGSG
jgi:hypothetical protein